MTSSENTAHPEFDKFKSMLKRGIVWFQYTKVDGTIRDARGTLDPAMWAASNDPGDKVEDPKDAKFTRYFDLGVGEWRAFINVNLIQFAWSGKTFIVARPKLLSSRATVGIPANETENRGPY